MTGKYKPLENYLAEQPKSTFKIMLTFEKVEIILGEKLPPSAYHHKAWWANEHSATHGHAHTWLNVGWRVESFDQRRTWVIFQRIQHKHK